MSCPSLCCSKRPSEVMTTWRVNMHWLLADVFHFMWLFYLHRQSKGKPGWLRLWKATQAMSLLVHCSFLPRLLFFLVSQAILSHREERVWSNSHHHLVSNVPRISWHVNWLSDKWGVRFAFFGMLLLTESWLFRTHPNHVHTYFNMYPAGWVQYQAWWEFD